MRWYSRSRNIAEIRVFANYTILGIWNLEICSGVFGKFEIQGEPS